MTTNPGPESLDSRSFVLQQVGGNFTGKGRSSRLSLQLPRLVAPKSDSLAEICLNGDLKALHSWLHTCKGKGLDPSAEINTLDAGTGKYPLMLAVLTGSAELVELLLQLEVDLSARDSAGCTAFHWAAAIPSAAVLLQFVRLGMDVNLQEWTHGQSPLHLAARVGNDRGVKALLESPEVRVNQGADGGATPLMLAIISGSNIEVVTMLITHPRIDLARQDRFGRNAIWWTAHLYKTEFCSILLNSNAPLHPHALHQAARSSAGLDIVNMLLARGSDPNLLDPDGMAPIHIAAINSSTSVLSLLLNTPNVNPHLLSRAGLHCIQYAVAAGSPGSLKGLLATIPQSVSTITPDGLSLVHLAACRCCPRVLKHLFQYASEELKGVPSHTLSGKTAIDLLLSSAKALASQSAESFSGISQSPFLQCLQVLIANGADVTDNFQSILRSAVEIADLEIVQYLFAQFPQQFAARKYRLSEICSRNTACIWSVEQYLRVIQYLLEIGVVADSHDALHVAAAAGKLEYVQSFVDTWRFPIDAPSGGSLRMTPVMFSLAESNNDATSWLLSKGASLTAADSIGRLPIHFAAQFCDDLDLFARCLPQRRQLREEFLTGCQKPCFSPYHSLSITKLIELAPLKLQLLLKGGFDITKKTSAEETALHYACSSQGSVILVQLLVASGCDQMNANTAGMTPLHHACLDRNPTKVGVLLFLKPNLSLQTRKSKSSALHCAVRARRIDIAEFLLTHQAMSSHKPDDGTGFHIDQVDKKGRTLLHWAASFGDSSLCHLLLNESAANPRLLDCRGQSPLHLATRSGHLFALKALLNRATKETGPNVRPLREILDQRGHTPLHIAIKYGHYEPVSFLLSVGANITARDDSCRNALHYASISADPNIFMIVLEYLTRRAQLATILNSVDTSSSTALHLAVERGNAPVVERLVCIAGLDFDLKNQNGETPLAIAHRCGFLHLSRILEVAPLHPPSAGAAQHQHQQEGANTPRKLVSSTSHSELHKTLGEGDSTEVTRRKASMANPVTATPSTPRKHLDFTLCESADDRPLKQATSQPAKRFSSAVLKGTVEALHRFWRRYGSRLLYDINCCVDPHRRADWTALHQYASTSNSECMAVLLAYPLIKVDFAESITTPLHEAVQANSLACAYLLLEAGANPHAVTPEGSLPLHLAVTQNASEQLKKLILSRTIERTTLDRSGKSPLHLAAQQGDSVMMKCLLDGGVPPDRHLFPGDTDPNPPLHIAVKFGNIECCKLLLAAGANINSTGSKQRSPLHIAAGVDNIEILNLIIQKKPNLEARDEYGLTPFLVACRTGSVGSAEALITAGAAMEAEDRDHRGALHQAVEAGAIGILSALVASQRLPLDTPDTFGFTPLHLALQSGNELIAIELTEKCKLDLLKLSLQKPVNILGQTELHMAASSGCTSFVRMLLKAGVYRGVLDSKGSPPLFYALSRNHLDTAAILLDSPEGSLDLVPIRTGKQPLSIVCENGWADCADHLITVRHHSPNWQNADGSISMHACAKSLSTACLSFCLSNNADVDRLSGAGFSPLHLAILQAAPEGADAAEFAQRKREFIQILLPKASINLQTKHLLESPLHLAASLGDLAITRLLIERSPIIDCTDASSKTPFLLAIERKQPQIYLELLALGADPLLTDSAQNSPLHQLVAIGDFQMAYVLYKLGADISTPRQTDGLTPVQIAAGTTESAPSGPTAGLLQKLLPTVARPLLLPTSAEGFLKQLLADSPEPVSALLEQPDPSGRSAAHHAARVGSLGLLEFLRSLKIPLDKPDHGLQTPLHFAAAANHAACLSFLVRHSAAAAILGADAAGNTALHYACDTGSVEAVKLLLSLGFDVASKNVDSVTPLLLAITSRSLPLVKLLLAQTTGLSQVSTLSDVSPLHLAPTAAIATLLIKRFPALITQKDSRGNLPIHYAAAIATEASHLELLVRGRPAEGQLSSNGSLPVHFAALAGNLLACKMLFPPVKGLLSGCEEKVSPYSPIHCAVLSPAPAAPQVTQLLLDLGAKANDRDPKGQAPLHYAAQIGSLPQLSVLLSDKDVLIDPQDWGGHTPLHLAAAEDHCAAIRLLASKGANLKARTANGATPLHSAAYANRVDAIHLLLYYGLPLDTPCIPSGDTPLMCAAITGANNALDFLLRVGANPQAVNCEGNSALHIAAAVGDVNGVRLLLDMSVPQIQKNHSGDLPIHLAAYFGHVEVIKLLVEASPIIVKYVNAQKFLPLHLAAVNKQKDAIAVLLQYANPDITLKDARGMTPFHFSCLSGSESLVRRHLVEIFEIASKRALTGRMADFINIYDQTGYTPFQWAAISPSTEVFQLLALDTGGGDIDLCTRDSFKHSMLHLLSGGDKVTSLRFFIERILHNLRASQDFSFDSQGFTPLTLAVNNSFTETVFLLLRIAKNPRHECRVLANADSGLTLLHLAILRNNPDIVSMLLEHGADLNAKTTRGETPLDWAITLNSDEITQLLKKKGALSTL